MISGIETVEPAVLNRSRELEPRDPVPRSRLNRYPDAHATIAPRRHDALFSLLTFHM